MVPRTESCQAFNFALRWRAVPLRHQGWERRFFTAVPLACRASSQPNNARAWGADNFLTFLTASSTALMPCTVSGKSVCGKPVRHKPMLPRPKRLHLERTATILPLVMEGFAVGGGVNVLRRVFQKVERRAGRARFRPSRLRNVLRVRHQHDHTNAAFQINNSERESLCLPTARSHPADFAELGIALNSRQRCFHSGEGRPLPGLDSDARRISQI